MVYSTLLNFRKRLQQLFIASVLGASINAPADTLTSYVNPFIGTAPGGSHFGFSGDSGDVFPGAAWPRGMVQWSPDTPSNPPGGYYYPDTSIKGFSVRHFSGRGCQVYQDFAFMPVIGLVSSSPGTNFSLFASSFSHANETATPGYYRVRLGNGVQVELTVTLRTGIGRFTFPATNAATVLVNAGSSITGTTTNTSISVVGGNQVQGFATAAIGCGSELYTVYFAAQFDHPFASVATWNGATLSPASTSASGAQVGAVLTFDASVNPTIYAKFGLSFVSVSNALANLNAENPTWDFNGTSAAAANAWNNVLNKIVISGGAASDLQTFYTALYHCFFHPNIFNDANGQYLGMDKLVHTVPVGHYQYENIPGWDIYRSGIALDALLTPSDASDILQSLVNYAQQGGGGLPRWEQANRNSGGMIGDGPLPIIATAYAFGATNFDTASALTAMRLDAGKSGTTSDGNTVRSGLTDYINLGYVSGSASTTLEYASADFALAQFGQAMGDTTNYTFLMRSGNWKSLFNSSTGYLQPRNSDGTWVTNVTPSSQTGFTEGSTSQYTWMVPFNLRGLFDLMGGNSNAVARLDTYFTDLNDGPGSIYAFMGNEPDEVDPWEYAYAGAPAKTQAVVRRILTQLYTNTPAGLPGNDDAGALSSWGVFGMLGLFPMVPGVGGFVVGSPFFPSVIISLENGQQILIEGTNASPANPYVQNLSINRTSTTSLWVPFSSLREGAVLAFTLGNTASSWGSGPADAPPSFDNSILKPSGLLYETELLTVAATSSVPHRIIFDSGFSRMTGTILDATAIGQFVVYGVPNVPAGSYDVRVGVKKFGSRGIWQAAIGRADNFNGTVISVGGAQDEYAPDEAFIEVDLGTWTAAADGDQWVRFEVVGKNSSSSGYGIVFDYIQLIPTPPVLQTSLAGARNSLVISWPGWATNFNLYSAPDLTAPVYWTPVTNPPASSNGVLSVSVPVNPGSSQFFRLSSP